MWHNMTHWARRYLPGLEAAGRVPEAPASALPQPEAADIHAFEQALHKSECIALFGASWCASGQRTGQRLLALAQRRSLPVLAIDVDHEPALVGRYHVTAVPSLLMMRQGQVVDRRLGEMTESELEGWVEAAGAGTFGRPALQ